MGARHQRQDAVDRAVDGGWRHVRDRGGRLRAKHVQQLVEENHLRWDSLGEFMAIAVSLEDVGFKHDSRRAMLLARTLDEATGRLLDNKVALAEGGQLDNRGSHLYLALYWAQALAAQSEDQSEATSRRSPRPWRTTRRKSSTS